MQANVCVVLGAPAPGSVWGRGASTARRRRAGRHTSGSGAADGCVAPLSKRKRVTWARSCSGSSDSANSHSASDGAHVRMLKYQRCTPLPKSAASGWRQPRAARQGCALGPTTGAQHGAAAWTHVGISRARAHACAGRAGGVRRSRQGAEPRARGTRAGRTHTPPAPRMRGSQCPRPTAPGCSLEVLPPRPARQIAAPIWPGLQQGESRQRARW